MHPALFASHCLMAYFNHNYATAVLSVVVRGGNGLERTTGPTRGNEKLWWNIIPIHIQGEKTADAQQSFTFELISGAFFFPFLACSKHRILKSISLYTTVSHWYSNHLSHFTKGGAQHKVHSCQYCSPQKVLCSTKCHLLNWLVIIGLVWPPTYCEIRTYMSFMRR